MEKLTVEQLNRDLGFDDGSPGLKISVQSIVKESDSVFIINIIVDDTHIFIVKITDNSDGTKNNYNLSIEADNYNLNTNHLKTKKELYFVLIHHISLEMVIINNAIK